MRGKAAKGGAVLTVENIRYSMVNAPVAVQPIREKNLGMDI